MQANYIHMVQTKVPGHPYTGPSWIFSLKQNIQLIFAVVGSVCGSENILSEVMLWFLQLF